MLIVEVHLQMNATLFSTTMVLSSVALVNVLTRIRVTTVEIMTIVVNEVVDIIDQILTIIIIIIIININRAGITAVMVTMVTITIGLVRITENIAMKKVAAVVIEQIEPWIVILGQKENQEANQWLNKRLLQPHWRLVLRQLLRLGNGFS